MKKHIISILIACSLVIGIALMFYPFWGEWYNQLHQGNIIQDYDRKVDKADQKKLTKEREKAKQYNKELLGHAELTDPFEPKSESELPEHYSSLLNLNGDGMMGYIEIPKIDVKLPIYHGTGYKALAAGVGHLERSSLPIGGAGTHAVLSAHTGSPEAELFTNLDKLVVGNRFYITVLGEKMAYEVERIKVVEPSDIGELSVDLTKDYVTLVTCTPYGINSHRLLVRGIRTKYVEEQEHEEKKSEIVNSKRQGLTLLSLCVLLIGVMIFIKIHKRRGTR